MRHIYNIMLYRPNLVSHVIHWFMCNACYTGIILGIGSANERRRYIPWQQGSWGHHGAHLGPIGPRWVPWTLLPRYRRSLSLVEQWSLVQAAAPCYTPVEPKFDPLWKCSKPSLIWQISNAPCLLGSRVHLGELEKKSNYPKPTGLKSQRRLSMIYRYLISNWAISIPQWFVLVLFKFVSVIHCTHLISVSMKIMVPIFNEFCWMKFMVFRFKFHRSLFLTVQLTVGPRCFRYGFDAEQGAVSI